MRERARAVVIGGGVGGCSVAYWLARLGWDDVVLCERADLTSGSTFHSAGLVGQLRGSLSLTRMMMASVDLYRSLGEEVGLETGWHEVGSLRLASSEERMEELRRQAGWAKTFGLPLELVSAEEAQRLFPPMSVEGVLGAAYLPTDGYIDPSQLTLALAEGARRHGVEIATQTRVTAIGVERELRRKPAGLRTNILIALGSALFTILSVQIAHAGGTPDRIAAQIVTGIGFLGAGAILRSGKDVRGMTTAATIWVNAAIGMAAGAGEYVTAGVATLVTLIVLVILPPVEAYFERRIER